MLVPAALIALALAVALMLRPWRLLAGGALITPLLAVLAVLPGLWALPRLMALPLQLQWSGACLVVLMLGWPLAIPTLVAVGALATLLGGGGWQAGLSQTLWLGVMPATFALALGAAIRRWIGPHPFVYLIVRAFLGTVACLFAAGLLAQWSGQVLPGVDSELSLVGRWLMAWGDGFVTGMLAAIFVAFRPQWLATWSDPLYLPRPRDPQ
jgi:uncharacterized membrane protein